MRDEQPGAPHRPDRPVASTAARTAVVSIMCMALAACSTREFVGIALSGDPEAALSNLARDKTERYKRNPLELMEDAKRADRTVRKLVALLSGRVIREWGEDEVVTPDNKRYVKYTENYRSRAIVDFDHGTVTVETVARQDAERSLRNAIVTTLMTPDDPRAVDLWSDRTVTLSGRPYLSGLVRDHHGRAVDGPHRAEAFAEHLVDKRTESRVVETREGRKTARYVRFTMVNDFQVRQAQRYAPAVAKYAERNGVSTSLVFAVIETESAFNPFAVSSAPAYGLMQLVPTTGGRDAFRRVEGYDHTPSKEYLFDPENNIKLGTAYLRLLDERYLADVSDPVTREYCTIAAYNGGAGNVLRLFDNNRNKAVARINRLSPPDVYRMLRDDHPRAETRRYLEKVLHARKRFVSG